jgi:tetratricopeptide (TPR) repeat protein
VSTTKLTRKEISADPIHDALIQVVDFLRSRARIIAVAVAAVVLMAVLGYFGLNYLEARGDRAQLELAKGMDYYHGLIDAAKAKDDPYASGPNPLFRSEADKYRAASQIFSSVVSSSGASKVGVMARYYLGLCQIRLGQKEAIANLEAVSNNKADRTVGYLAKKALAGYYLETGEGKKAQEILQSMMKDPQCDLPREDLQVDLSRAYSAQGNREEALKVLKEAQETGRGGMLQSLIFRELSRLQGTSGNAPQP